MLISYQMISIVVAFSTNGFGIGVNNALPWNIPEDMKRFKELTQNSIVIMGRKTWESIPIKRRPLKGRVNVILTNDCTTRTLELDENVMYVSEDGLDAYVNAQKEKNIFIIGGQSIYAKYMGIADTIYATVVDTGASIAYDAHFPIDNFWKYELLEYSPPFQSNGLSFRFMNFKLRATWHGEFVYLKTLNNLLEAPQRKDRTGTGTRSTFGPQMKFDISKSIPLITTKFVGFKSILKELLFFLKGKTNSKDLEEQGVNIWKANTTREFLDNRGLTGYKEGDMGPMYGFNLRHFGAQYNGCHANYVDTGYDQLQELVKGLRSDPYSRRHMITTYNPAEVDASVLAPCHGIVTQFYVDEDKASGKRHLSCHTYQRSMDTFLGCPYNIASYATLVYIIGAMCDMQPHELIISTGDCHIYNNHQDQARLQLSRSPLPFPILELSNAVKHKTFDELSLDDFNIVGYLHHPAIKAPMAV